MSMNFKWPNQSTTCSFCTTCTVDQRNSSRCHMYSLDLFIKGSDDSPLTILKGKQIQNNGGNGYWWLNGYHTRELDQKGKMGCNLIMIKSERGRGSVLGSHGKNICFVYYYSSLNLYGRRMDIDVSFWILFFWYVNLDSLLVYQISWICM